MKPVDPNQYKVVPNVIHLDREVVNMVSPLLAIIGFVSTMKKEECSTLMICDNVYDSLNGDIVDVAFGAGVVSHLCLSGIGKGEKSSKVARYRDILQMIAKME